MTEIIDQILNTTTNNNNTNSMSYLKYEITYEDPNLNVTLLSDCSNESFNIDIKLKIPNHSDTEEIIYRLCSFEKEKFVMLEIQEIELIMSKSTSDIYERFKFLVNYDDEFLSKLIKEVNVFIKKQNQDFYDNLTAEAIFNKSEESPLNDSFKPNIISYWRTFLSNQHLKTDTVASDSAAMNMAKVYHSLIHSSQMFNVLKRERNYAIDLNSILRERDQTLRFIMDEAQLDSETAKWSFKVENLKAKQQRNFKKFLQKLYDQIDRKSHISEDEEEDDVYELNDHLDSLDLFREKLIHVPLTTARSTSGLYSQPIRLEESYTIQLGAQLKSTHNLRLIRCNIFDFCKDRFDIHDNLETVRKKKKKDLSGKKSEISGIEELEPQAIQTALSLYSDKMCALILLVENSFEAVGEDGDQLDESLTNEITRSNAENWHYLVDLCEKNGCEFHFPDIEAQKKLAYHYASTAKKNHSKTNFSTLNIGDFWISKHSNLSQVHVIFHLASNEKKSIEKNLHSSSISESPLKTLKLPDLSSRHPVILGLRNILKACISNNINTLTIPLLLTHEMTEEMTISWVMKRAELVLKCLKGFMIEFVQWGAQESRTIQFVVPHGLMDETFNSLSNLIPTIFRESRTVNLV